MDFYSKTVQNRTFLENIFRQFSFDQTFKMNDRKMINSALYEYMHNSKAQYFKEINTVNLSSKCSVKIKWGKRLKKKTNPVKCQSTDLETYILGEISYYIVLMCSPF